MNSPLRMICSTFFIAKTLFSRWLVLFLILIAGWSIESSGQSIRINEVMASNKNTIDDAFGDSDDWVELINTGDVDINLAGLFLTDDPSNRAGCVFSSEFPDSTILSPGDFIIIWADKDLDQGMFHFNFKIKGGETVSLFSFDDEIELIDQVTLPDTKADDYSFDRFPDGSGEFILTNEPTPAATNSEIEVDLLAQVNFSENGGFFSEPFYLLLSCQEPGAAIYYTIDGSIPNQNSIPYSAPILIDERADDPNGISMVETTIGQSLSKWKEPVGLVNKARVIRAKAFKDDKSSNIITHTYFVDPLKSERYSFPVFSLALDSLALFHADTGIYHGGSHYDGGDWETANYSQRGRDWERIAHLEYFKEGETKLDQEVGVRISGNFTRSAGQKSLRLYARSEYGESKFNYSLFSNSDEAEYKRVTLRNSGQDLIQAFMRDPFLHSLLDTKGLDKMESEPSIVFINGEYWGIHMLRERQDKNYLASHYRIDEDSLDILEGNHEIVEGSDEHYQKLYDFIGNNEMSNDAAFSTVDTMMDVENFKRYMAIELYVSNKDWPNNNIKYWRFKAPSYRPDGPAGLDGRWRWFLFDTDLSMGRLGTEPEINTLESTLSTHASWQSFVMRNLLGSTELPGNKLFRESVIAEFADNMNTIFHPDRVIPLFDEWAMMLESEIDEQTDRWRVNNVSVWKKKVEIMREFFIYRPGFFRQHILDQFQDVSDTLHVTLTSTDEQQGTIIVNETSLDANGLERSENSFLPWTGVYFNNIPIKLEAKPKVGYKFIRWEGIDSTDPIITLIPTKDTTITAVYEEDDEWGYAVISEIYFDTPSEQGSDEEKEFIELYNPGPGSYDLSGVKISRAIDFEFPESSTIASKSYVLLARNADAYQDLDIPVYQWTGGKLSNSGEQIEITDVKNDLVDELLYESISPWPVGASSTGYSIEWKQSEMSNDLAQYWHRSYVFGGTPGVDNSMYTPKPQIYINEVMAGSNNAYSDQAGEADDWIELYNPSDEDIILSGLWISDDSGNPTNSLLLPHYPDSITLPANGFFTLWLDKDLDQGVQHLDLKLSKGGETLFLYQDDGLTLIDSITFGPQTDDASYGRYPDGSDNWELMHHLTPLEPNRSDIVIIPEVLINEVMTEKWGSWIISGGIDEDWIELYNPTDEAINVGGLYFHTDHTDPYPIQIDPFSPSKTTIPAQGFLYFIADGKDDLGSRHINLQLDNSGGELLLAVGNLGKYITVDSIGYPPAIREVSYGRYPDGSANWSNMVRYTRGQPNKPGPTGLDKLYINELASRNRSYYPDEMGVYEDWIEIYNANSFEVDLGGLFFSETFENLSSWRIPTGFPDSTTILPNSYRMFRADALRRASVTGVGFMLNGGGGSLALSYVAEGRMEIVDSVSYPNMLDGQSYGRIRDAQSDWKIFNAPTPDISNNSSMSILGHHYALATFVIYPNPSDGYVIVHQNGSSEATVKYEMIDIRGNVVYLLSIQDLRANSNVRIDYPETILPGLYYLRISSKNQISVLKFIVN